MFNIPLPYYPKWMINRDHFKIRVISIMPDGQAHQICEVKDTEDGEDSAKRIVKACNSHDFYQVALEQIAAAKDPYGEKLSPVCMRNIATNALKNAARFRGEQN